MKKIGQILPVIILAACSELTDLNKNIKDPTSVPGTALFTSGQKALVDQVVETEVNFNIFRLVMQYWTQTTYTDESNYDLVSRTIPEWHWIHLYRDALKDLDEAYKTTEKTDFTPTGGDPVKNNQLAIIDIMTVYGYSVLVDTFGDVPYTEALNADNLLPKYDDGLTIYKDLIDRLNAAIGALDPSAASFPSASDNIYRGDVNSWVKFANSLKLRLGITISDVGAESALAKKTVEDAAAAGVFSSNSDNAEMSYLTSPPNTHPVHVALVLSGRADYVATETIINAMNTLNDPRIGAYFTMVGDTAYVGGVVGASNSYSEFSHVHPNIAIADAKGIVLTYSEVEFLLSEASERGYSVGATAEEHYNNAITASIKYWGGSDAAANSYLAQGAVAYATAEGGWKEKIGAQSWISLYNRGYEAWNTWKRLDSPSLATPAQPQSATPVRFTYPIAEQTLNGASRAVAAAKIGGDAVTTKIFWDVD